MKLEKWLPLYDEIVREFGFSFEEDRAAAEELGAIVRTLPNRTRPWLLRKVVAGKEVVVTGKALGIREAKRVAESAGRKGERMLVIAAGDSCRQLLRVGHVPDIVVTDLDGDLRTQLKAFEELSIGVVHAHGDNRHLLQEVRRIAGGVLGTCQCAPPRNLANFGGFTDGDRAVLMALELGAERVGLAGFDFIRARPDTEVKRRKLRWAQRIIEEADDDRVRW